MAMTPRERHNARWGALKTERSSWDAHWKEISEYLLPRSGRFFTEDRNRGNRRHNSIYDSTGTKALRVLGAGLMGGATSPARPWFRLATPDKDLMKYAPVKVWLNHVTHGMLNIFQRSNTYRTLHNMYEELGGFGTGAAVLMDDFDRVIHHYPLTIGEYALGTDYKGNVNTLYREFDKTVGALVEEFGLNNCSQNVRNFYDRGSLDQYITIIHAIEPRRDRDVRKRDARNMPSARAISSKAGRTMCTSASQALNSSARSHPGGGSRAATPTAILAPAWSPSGILSSYSTSNCARRRALTT
jgi:hypothetical protein